MMEYYFFLENERISCRKHLHQNYGVVVRKPKADLHFQLALKVTQTIPPVKHRAISVDVDTIDLFLWRQNY